MVRLDCPSHAQLVHGAGPPPCIERITTMELRVKLGIKLGKGWVSLGCTRASLLANTHLLPATRRGWCGLCGRRGRSAARQRKFTKKRKFGTLNLGCHLMAVNRLTGCFQLTDNK